MIPPGVDLEPHLALRRDLRRALGRARRAERQAPRVDPLAMMQNWTDPPRNKPPGLDPAAQFLHDAFDGVAPGVVPLVPRAPAGPATPRPCQTCEGVDPPARVGDDCKQGGEVVGVGGWTLVDAGVDYLCMASVTCRGDNKCDCYDLESVSREGNGVRNSCGGGVDELVSVNCSYVEEDGKGGCSCDITCLMLDGTTKTVDWYQNPRAACGDVDPNEEESWFAYAEPRPCDSPGGWGEAPGQEGTPGGWMEEGKRAWDELASSGAAAWEGFSEWAEGQDWGGIFGGLDPYQDALDECLDVARSTGWEAWSGWCHANFYGQSYQECHQLSFKSSTRREGFCYRVFGD